MNDDNSGSVCTFSFFLLHLILYTNEVNRYFIKHNLRQFNSGPRPVVLIGIDSDGRIVGWLVGWMFGGVYVVFTTRTRE